MRKTRIKIKLPIWQLDLIDNLASNRSQFFRDLFLEMLKKQGLLETEDIKTQSCWSLPEVEAVAEKLRSVWGKEYRFQKVRKIGKNFSKKVPEYLKKDGITIFLDSWMLEIVERVEPNRTFFFSTMLLCKIEKELLKRGAIKEGAIITKRQGDLYLSLMKDFD